jgi:hypothetical protein
MPGMGVGDRYILDKRYLFLFMVTIKERLSKCLLIKGVGGSRCLKVIVSLM